ncbi:hypothetical protein ACK1JC_12395 [Acinetobacter sp. TY2]|uniref:hypothetical protein n=1 Tax=Acinetobacter sp. TY2 TaxID=3387403 RepID=UPI0039177BC6
MNKIILATLLLSLTITGCQKEAELSPEDQSKLSAQFEKSDAAITAFLDKLDSPTTPIAEKKQIACVDFPAEYKTNYVPSMLKTEGNTYTEEKLLADMDMALDYYKKKDSIQC